VPRNLRSGKVYSYLLVRPNGIPFYAGVGRCSRYKAKKANKWAERIRAKIEREGGRVLYIVFDQSSWDEACTHEKELIAKYGRQDLGTGVLVNATDGGEGVPGRIMTKDQLAHLGSQQRGKKWAPDDPRRELISRQFKGRKPNHSPELKQQLSERMKKFNEGNAERNRARKGISLSEERRAQIKATAAAQPPMSEERKEAFRQMTIARNRANKGKPQSEERKAQSRETLARALKIRWERYRANNPTHS